MTTIYVTFGQRYRYETHPVDERANPDGWFEFEGDMSVFELERAIWRHLTPPGRRIGEFAFTYVMAPRTDGPGSYPRGCLARFGVTDQGRAHDLEEITRA